MDAGGWQAAKSKAKTKAEDQLRHGLSGWFKRQCIWCNFRKKDGYKAMLLVFTWLIKKRTVSIVMFDLIVHFRLVKRGLATKGGVMVKEKPFMVVVYGCFARSFSVTNVNHNEKIFSVLRSLKINFSVIHVDNEVDFIDQLSVRPYEHNSHHLTELIRLNQPEVDKHILAKYPNVSGVFDASYYNDSTRLSALRNSYLETKVAQCLKRYGSEFGYAIVLNADLWFEKELNPEWLNQKAIIVGDQNPAGGYTNGFYCGPVNELIQLLNSFDSLSNFQLWDFESIALHRSQKSNIPISPAPFRFLKIRASGEPAYKTMGFLWPKIRKIAWNYYRSAEIPTVLKIRFFLIEFPADFAKVCLAKFKLGVKQVLTK